MHYAYFLYSISAYTYKRFHNLPRQAKNKTKQKTLSPEYRTRDLAACTGAVPT